MFAWLKSLFSAPEQPKRSDLKPLFPWATEINGWARIHCPEALSMTPGAALPHICSQLGIGPYPAGAPYDVVVRAILMEIRKPEHS